MDFMKYSDRPLPLMEETIDSIVDAYNLTPPNFENPPDATIEKVVAAVCKQMKEDKTYELSASPKEDKFFSENASPEKESNIESTSASTPKISDFKLDSPD
jgi:hypothetical protein